MFYKCLNDYSCALTECSTKIRSQINNLIPTLVGPHLSSSNLANACTNNPPCPCFSFKYSESNDLDVAGLFDYFDIIIWRLWTFILTGHRANVHKFDPRSLHIFLLTIQIWLWCDWVSYFSGFPTQSIYSHMYHQGRCVNLKFLMWLN